jgi:hypothetical protein
VIRGSGDANYACLEAESGCRSECDCQVGAEQSGLVSVRPHYNASASVAAIPSQIINGIKCHKSTRFPKKTRSLPKFIEDKPIVSQRFGSVSMTFVHRQRAMKTPLSLLDPSSHQQQTIEARGPRQNLISSARAGKGIFCSDTSAWERNRLTSLTELMLM